MPRIAFTLLLILLLVLAGCGQRGDLFLPEEEDDNAGVSPTPVTMPDRETA